MNAEHICKQACELTKTVGGFIHQEAKAFSFDKVEEKSFNQLVSYVDKTAEEKLVKGLSEIFPEAGFITEEQTIATEEKEYMWVIDPLDGTTNFIHAIPVYSVSVGLLRNHKPVMGIVYEINRDELFYAWEGSKAYLNGNEISVKQNASLSKSLLATGFPYYDFDGMTGYLNALQYFMKHTQGMRRLGSAAVDLAYVACGRFDGYFEYGLSPWDVAGGVFIVQQAGGKVSDFKGGDDCIFGRAIVASSIALYPDFFEVVRREFASV
ncbi:MAG: inositol monophosphatase family protein [Bacteroidota bacterium]